MLVHLRYSTLLLLVLATAVLSWYALNGQMGWWWPLATLVLVGVGIRDLLQTRHAILRNYPVLGHLRFFFEYIRPEIRQYFFESDRETVPFSRQQRSLVYQRAKSEPSEKAFGTLGDVYRAGHEFVGHSMRPAPEADPAGFRVPIGGPDCRQPYSASIFNISALSFGALSANAIQPLPATMPSTHNGV